MSLHSQRLHQRGVTLIELVISIVIIGIGVAAITLVFNQNVSRSADPMISVQATAIAQAYLEEITGKAFIDPDGSEADEPAGRSEWDDVRDYNGLSGPPADQQGILLGLPGYNVSVSIDFTTASLGGLTNPNIERVDVTVTGPSGISVHLSGYRTNY